jgi:hypothetical protein
LAWLSKVSTTARAVKIGLLNLFHASALVDAADLRDNGRRIAQAIRRNHWSR